ncbi:MAG: restriction endonuclease subunit S [bacterium]|nr:restriction endonuclease subunit S [bacterium]
MNSDEWKKLKVEDVAEVVGGGTPSTSNSDYWGDEIPWLTPRDLSNYPERFIAKGERSISKKGLQNSSARLIPKGSVLLTSRAPIGYLAIAKNEVCTNQGFKSFVVDENKAHNEFVFYLLKHNVELLKSLGTGTTFAEISATTLRNLEFEFPPLPTQRRIAGILSALDEKIELNRQTNATLEAMGQSIFREWFLDNEDVVNWDVVPLPEIINLNLTRTLKKGSIAPYLDMANMPTQGHRAIEWRDRPFGSGTKFVNGDTLLARITPCLENGKTAFVDFLEDGQVGWGSTEYIVFSPKPPLPPEYGYYLARTEEVRNHAIQNMIGTSGRQRASASCFDSFMISVPPAELAARFGEVARSLMAEIKANDEESRTLASIREVLLPKLMNGEFDLEE